MPGFRFEKVARKGDVAAGQGLQVEAGGRLMGLFNVDGRFYVIDNACTHRGGPLSEGHLDGKEVICPWHAFRFNVTTGVCDLDKTKVETYPVKVEGDDIYVGVPE